MRYACRFDPLSVVRRSYETTDSGDPTITSAHLDITSVSVVTLVSCNDLPTANQEMKVLEECCW